MPEINIPLSDNEHRMLSDEYKKMSIDWLRTNIASVPPPFEQWLAGRLTIGIGSAASREREIEELRIFNVIEKLITGLQPHAFGLAHLGKPDAEPAESATALAQSLAADLGLSPLRAKRIQDLLAYYSKSAKEIADLAHVGVTKRAYGALHEAYRELVQRTEKAFDHLGEDKALGRVEGGIAILVSLQVMNRNMATEKTEAFRQQVRDSEK